MTDEKGRVLLLSPHSDDAVLFASYSVLRHRPIVAECYTSVVQGHRYGISQETRFEESRLAVATLGATLMSRSLGVPDDAVNEEMLGRAIGALGAYLAAAPDYEVTSVLAPAEEDGGHEQHNAVARVAAEVFGDRVVSYLTYRRGYARSRSENEVLPELGWRARKLAAMACYASQIDLGNTRPWFSGDWDREWLA